MTIPRWTGSTDKTAAADFPPPPRRVTRRRPLFLPSLWVIWPLFLIMFWLALSAPRLARDAWLQWRGQLVTAQVINHAAAQNRKNPSFAISYKYTAQGDEVIGHSAVTHDDYNRYWIGSEIPVRTAPLGGWHVDRPEIGASSYLSVRFPLLLALTGAAVLVGVVLRSAWATLIATPRMLQRGAVATGRVTNCVESRSCRSVHFEFETVVDGRLDSVPRRFKGVARVSADQSGTVDVGDEVTVFYNPRRPGRRPVAHELCEFHVDYA